MRVKLDPVAAGSGERLRARGVRLGLARFGAGPSQVSTSPKPAVITFHALGFDRVREPQVQREAKVGSLHGQIVLPKGKASPIFRVERELEQALKLEQPLEPLPPDGEGSAEATKPRRAFELTFQEATFENPLQGQLLLLPDDVVLGCHFVELYAELEVGGAVEAGRAVNDVLDTPIVADAPLPIEVREFRLTIRDHEQKPLSGAAYELELDGKTVSGTTGGDGKTLVHRTRTRSGKLRVSGFEYLVTFQDELTDDIAQFQGILNALGFSAGAITGTLNRPTQDAIRAYQRRKSLEPTGDLDPNTRQHLRNDHVEGEVA